MKRRKGFKGRKWVLSPFDLDVGRQLGLGASDICADGCRGQACDLLALALQLVHKRVDVLRFAAQFQGITGNRFSAKRYCINRVFLTLSFRLNSLWFGDHGLRVQLKIRPG